VLQPNVVTNKQICTNQVSGRGINKVLSPHIVHTAHSGSCEGREPYIVATALSQSVRLATAFTTNPVQAVLSAVLTQGLPPSGKSSCTAQMLSGSTFKETVTVDESASTAERKSHSSMPLGKPQTEQSKSCSTGPRSACLWCPLPMLKRKAILGDDVGSSNGEPSFNDTVPKPRDFVKHPWPFLSPDDNASIINLKETPGKSSKLGDTIDLSLLRSLCE